MISVICIDPELWFYHLLQKIAVERDIQIIGEAQTAEKGLELVRQHKSKLPLLVVLNAELPDMSGEMVCRRIHRHWPEIRCLMFMNRAHWPTLSRLVDSPAKGVLTKDGCYLSLQAIQAIHAGKTYVQPDLVLDLIYYRENPPMDSLNKLSPREYEVSLMLSKNKTYEEIAQSLHLQVRTIYNVRTSIFKKLYLDSHDQLCELMSGNANYKKKRGMSARRDEEIR